MTNREKYKQAFSVLQTSGKISLEVEKMAVINKKAPGSRPFSTR